MTSEQIESLRAEIKRQRNILRTAQRKEAARRAHEPVFAELRAGNADRQAVAQMTAMAGFSEGLL